MPLIELIIVIVIVGFIMWVINNYVPMSAGLKKLLNIAVIVIVVLWLLSILGFLDGVSAITV